MDKEEQFGGFPSPFSDQDLNFNLITDNHDLSSLLAATHRLHHCRADTKHQTELIESLVKLPAIGLKLQISPSLLKQMQRSTQSKRKRTGYATQARADSDCERLKASILGALMLRIGSWQLVARNEGDLVAKCYFAKRQLVWEILRNGLKEKMEIEWSNIIGIQASTEENQPGILELELHHPPKFYKEIEPEPRKHTQWTDGADFTEGQAYVNRRHCIVFPPRVLGKHYQKLISKDQRLYELSQRPFPTFNSSFFPSAAALFNQISAAQFEEKRFKIPSSLQFDVPPLHPAHSIHSLTSPRSVVDYTPGPHFSEIISHEEQKMHLWNQVNTLRRYETEAAREGKPLMISSGHDQMMNSGYDHSFYSAAAATANPMASLVWLAQNVGAAAAANLSTHQPSSSLDHIDQCFNGAAMNTRTTHVLNDHLFNYYNTYSNQL